MVNGEVDIGKYSIQSLIKDFSKSNIIGSSSSIYDIKREIISHIESKTDRITVDDYLSNRVLDFIDNMYYELEENDFITFINSFEKKEIYSFVKEFSLYDCIFDDLIPDELDKKEYSNILWQIFSCNLEYDGTGIVIVNFDDSSFFPSYCEFNVFFNNMGKLEIEDIDLKMHCEESIIRVFADDGQSIQYLTGVGTSFEEFVKELYVESLDDVLCNFIFQLEHDGILIDDAYKKVEEFKSKYLDKEDQFNPLIDEFKIDNLKMIEQYIGGCSNESDL